MASTKNTGPVAKSAAKSRVNVDRLIETARIAWRKADDTGEAGRVKAVLPLIGKVPQAQFVKAAGLSSSTVSRYWKAAALAQQHSLTATEMSAHAADIVKAQKVEGGPDALAKAGSKSDMLATAGRLAAKKRVADTGGSKRRRNGGAGGTGDRPSVESLANALRLRVESASKGEAGAALQSRDEEALSRLVQAIVAFQSVKPDPKAQPSRVRSARKVAKVA